MSPLRTYLFIVLMTSGVLFSQVRVIKPVKTKASVTKFGFGAGLASSVLYLPINVYTNNRARGLNFCMTYDRLNYLRMTAEYTTYNKIDMGSTWKDVKAKTIEYNVNFISKTKDKTFYFYPMAGLSYNMFNGFFTGINDYLNLSARYSRNVTIKANWLGVNCGVGLDYNFENSAIYSCFKMRVGRTEGYNQINIMDVYTGIGWRYYINQYDLGKAVRGTRSRYSVKKVKNSDHK